MLPSKKVQRSPLPRIRIHNFSLVSDVYTSGWKNPGTPCPGIKKVYMVVMKPDSAPRYEDYKYEFLYLDFLAVHPPMSNYIIQGGMCLLTHHISEKGMKSGSGSN
jgi:hypothetical protein